MSFKELSRAYKESTESFYKNIVPSLCKEAQDELFNCESSTIRMEGKDPRVILTVNGKEFDITDDYKPGHTIFDFI